MSIQSILNGTIASNPLLKAGYKSINGSIKSQLKTLVFTQQIAMQDRARSEANEKDADLDKQAEEKKSTKATSQKKFWAPKG